MGEDYFFFGIIYFTSDDGSQNLIVYKPIPDTSELKKAKALIMFLVGNKGSMYL